MDNQDREAISKALTTLEKDQYRNQISAVDYFPVGEIRESEVIKI